MVPGNISPNCLWRNLHHASARLQNGRVWAQRWSRWGHADGAQRWGEYFLSCITCCIYICWNKLVALFYVQGLVAMCYGWCSKCAMSDLWMSMCTIYQILQCAICTRQWSIFNLMCKVLLTMYITTSGNVQCNSLCATYWYQFNVIPVAMCNDWCARYRWKCATAMIDVQRRVSWNPIPQLPLPHHLTGPVL